MDWYKITTDLTFFILLLAIVRYAFLYEMIPNLLPFALPSLVALYVFLQWKPQVKYNRKYKILSEIHDELIDLQLRFSDVRSTQAPALFVPDERDFRQFGMNKEEYNKLDEQKKEEMNKRFFYSRLYKEHDVYAVNNRVLSIPSRVDEELLGKEYNRFLDLLRKIRVLVSYSSFVIDKDVRQQESYYFDIKTIDKPHEIEVIYQEQFEKMKEEKRNIIIEMEKNAIQSAYEAGIDYRNKPEELKKLPPFDRELTKCFIEITDILRKKLN